MFLQDIAIESKITPIIRIVDSNDIPVTYEFIEAISQIVDPSERSGSGFGLSPESPFSGLVSGFNPLGFSPIGHRITVSTPICIVLIHS